MAESIIRLRVDSDQFDTRIKSATSSLLRMEEECRKVQGTFAVVEKEQLNFARSLGDMSTRSKTATGKIAELKSSITELSLMYRRLTDEEKQSPFGQALSSSIDKLKNRLKESQNALKDVRNGMGETNTSSKSFSDTLSNLSNNLGISIPNLTKIGIAMAAVSAAAKVAKDAFNQNEEAIDILGAALDEGRASYESFLDSLNGGNLSSFVSNLNTVIDSARQAYAELDRLQTMRLMDANVRGEKDLEIERMQNMLRSGRYIAPLDGRTPAMQNGDKLTKEQMSAISKNLQEAIGQSINMAKSELSQITATIDAKERSFAAILKTDVGTFREVTANNDKLEYYRAGVKKYEDFERSRITKAVVDTKSDAISYVKDNRPNPYQEFAKYQWTTRFVEEGDRFAEIQGLRKEQRQAQQNLYNTQARSYRSMNRAENITTPKVPTPKTPELKVETPAAPTSEVGSSIAQLQALQNQLREAQKQSTNNSKYQFYADYISQIQSQIDTITGKANTLATSFEAPLSPLQQMKAEAQSIAEAMEKAATPEEWQRLSSQLEEVNNRMAAFKGGGGGKLKDEGAKTATAWRSASNAIGSIGSALQAIDDPGVRVAGIIAEAIANIASTFAASLKGTFTPWDWVAAAASGTAVMLSTISSIKSATAGSFAHGGIVGGNNYSDGLTANVSTGEIILNRAQQNNLAPQLNQANSFRNGSIVGEVRGNKLLLVINNDLSSSGRKRLI